MEVHDVPVREVIDQFAGNACYPYGYALGFLRFLHRHAEAIDVLTYADLDWDDDRGFEAFYPREYDRWKQSLESGVRARDRIYVLLQYDVDDSPHRTMRLLADQAKLGLRGNTMLFHERHDRVRLQDEKQIELTGYPIDWPLCRRLQEDGGFVFGYHANAFERALFDFRRAAEVFQNDVARLRERLDIRFFSPHGGVRSAQGETNAHWIPPADCLNNLRWVHNRFGCRFDGNFSDGAPNGRIDPRQRDLRDFVRTWTPGKRYRVLLHPQYYGDDFQLSRRMLEADWYCELVSLAERHPDADPWEGVLLNAVTTETSPPRNTSCDATYSFLRNV